MFSCFTCGTESLTNKLLKKSLKNVKPKTKKALTTQQALRLPAQPHGQVNIFEGLATGSDHRGQYEGNGCCAHTFDGAEYCERYPCRALASCNGNTSGKTF